MVILLTFAFSQEEIGKARMDRDCEEAEGNVCKEYGLGF